MGMKSDSGYFKKTNGYGKMQQNILNIQFFASKFTVPSTPLLINKEKQSKHFFCPNKSQIIVSIDVCQLLVEQYSGRGTMINQYQERVDFGRVIGYINTPNGKISTTWGKIHYSKTGVHIVPYYQKKERD